MASRFVDTFPSFLDFWGSAQDEPVDAQVEAWAATYMAPWPELVASQLQDYAREGVDWREIARKTVFPFLGERLPVMRTAHANLPGACRAVQRRARRVLGFEKDIVFVIYVGIGCGAGWATEYAGSPAVLLGLENVAECGWSAPETLRGLVAHEIGHLAHDSWRAEQGKGAGSGPWWQLYREGFAQWCGKLIVGSDAWDVMEGGICGREWLAWCAARTSWLAGEFLRLVENGESVRPFFGSWYEVAGRRQCGYYLGYEVIRRLVSGIGVAEMALLDGDDVRLRQVLEGLVGRDLTGLQDL